MKKNAALMMIMICLLFSTAYAEQPDGYINNGDELKTDQLTAAREAVWQEYCLTRSSSEEMKNEIESQTLLYGDAAMRYYVIVKGDMPENGYPLYIALHGGGASDTPELNDEQWEQMKTYYSYWLDCGVYVAVRGVRDTWDTHFNPESYPLYDKLIEYMILTQNVDPNRVYLEGFSAGGDGVYAIAPRMADRFAAVNMSSGHPNGVSLINLYNLPIQLQAGQNDTDYSRNTVTAEYGIYLDELQAKEPGGYIHRVLIHLNKGHNYPDYEGTVQNIIENYDGWLKGEKLSYARINCFPPAYMKEFTRVPLPARVIWDLSTRSEMRETKSFYYLSAPKDADGILSVTLKGDNRIEADTHDFEGDFSIYLNEKMIDFSKPVIFIIDGQEIEMPLTPSLAVLRETTYDRGDPNFQFEARVDFKTENGKTHIKE